MDGGRVQSGVESHRVPVGLPRTPGLARTSSSNKRPTLERSRSSFPSGDTERPAGDLVGAVRPLLRARAFGSWLGVVGRRGLQSGSVVASTFGRRILRRMPRVQVYLPDELYNELKQRDLPASELLQVAVRAEVERRQALDATEQYLAELEAEVGDPTARQRTRAEAIARRVRDRQLDQAI